MMSGPIQRTAYSLTILFGMGVHAVANDLGPKFRGKVPSPFQNIDAACKQKFIRAGILHKNGKPAGHQLLSKPVLRVALVEAGNDGEYPKGALTPEILNYYSGKKPKPEDSNFIGLKAYRFSTNQRADIVKGLKFWGYSKIEFVDLNNNPDVKVFAYAKPEDSWAEAGFASLPANDTLFTAPLSTPVLFLNVTPGDVLSPLPVVTAHEFGHNLGIHHLGIALTNMPEDDCKDKIAGLYHQGVFVAFPPLSGKVNFGLIAFDSGLTHNLTFYERAARTYIRSNGTDFGTGLDPAPYNVP